MILPIRYILDSGNRAIGARYFLMFFSGPSRHGGPDYRWMDLSGVDLEFFLVDDDGGEKLVENERNSGNFHGLYMLNDVD